MDALTLHYARLTFAKAQAIYDLHRDLCRVFGRRDVGGYLYRTDVDRSERPTRRVVLVQSQTPGDWTTLGDQLAEFKVCERKWELATGQRYRFFLRANTTRAKKAELRELADVSKEAFRAARGKRLAVRGETELLAWLRRQGETHGFRLVETAFRQEDDDPVPVPAVRVLAERDVFWRANGKHGRHTGVDFEGLLVAEDQAKLAVALRDGIGPAKAFGFGLLSLASTP